ncbi:unnamed protein product [Durusdinium trenchii]
MVLTALVAAGVTGVGAGTYLTWDKYPKPFIVKQILAKLPGLLSKSLAGSPCSVDSIDFSTGCVFTIKLGGVRIGNLEPYKSPNLVKIESIWIKVDVKSFIKSGFKELVVDSLWLDGLVLTVEKRTLQSSNVTDLVALLKDKDDKEVDGDGTAPSGLGENLQGVVSNVVDTASKITQGAMDVAKGVKKEPPEEKKKLQVIVKQLEMTRISLEGVSAIYSENQTPTVHLAVKDIKLKDFSRQKTRPDQLVRLILKQIIFSSLNAVGGLSAIFVETAGSSSWWLLEQMGGALATAGTVVTSAGDAVISVGSCAYCKVASLFQAETSAEAVKVA